METMETLSKLYPFNSQFLKLEIKDRTYNLHYLDEGEKTNPSQTILLLHGNPTWSFFYRNIIKTLLEEARKRGTKIRIIVPDHLGMGLSSKLASQDERELKAFTLESRISHIQNLLDFLQVDRFSLVAHDWGGAIGMGVALQNLSKFEHLVLMNTAAFRSFSIPFRILICKTPILGDLAIRYLNIFAKSAIFLAVKNKLSKEVASGYLFPYRKYSDRNAISRFVQDIPLHSSHPSYQKLKEIEEALPLFKGGQHRKLLLWGAKDFCFHLGFLKKWEDIWQNDESLEKVIYPNAGHYLVEDASNDINNRIANFFIN